MDAAAPMISSIRPLRSCFSALCTSDFHTTLSAGFSFISFQNWRFRTLTVRNSSSSYSGEKITVLTSSELRQKKASTERKPDEKLASLRRLFSRADIQLDAYIIPSQDAHQSEFIADCFTRRAYLTGFTGSAGTAVVTHDKAALWTDGRYFLQAHNQLSHEWTLMKTGNPGVPTTTEWLVDVLTKNGSKVGIDPFLFSSAAAEELKEALSKKNHELIYMHNLNLVDEIWGDSRPEPPTAPIRIHDIKYAGSDITSKLSSLQPMLLEEGADGIAISMLDEVAWLLNLRGSDVPHSPVVYSYVIVERGSTATLFVDQRKVTPEVATYLKNAGVSVKPYEAILSEIGRLAGQGKKIWLDTSSMNAAIVNAYQSAYLRFKELGQKAAGNRKATTTDKTVVVGGHEGIYKVSPISLQKAIKNEAELEGMRQSHLRDAAALAEFWAWLEEEIHNRVSLTEVDVLDKLLQFRAKQHGFLDTSFDTISGYGPNGAIIHYKPEAHSCRCLDDQKLFLLDSGAQYVDGTTDITRTVHFGKPSSREKECFTRVLQGHISLDQAVFPENTPGFVLDVLARSFLWKIGLDYRHGTGHGVGAALNVHEGPQSISYRYGNMTSLYKGMVVSNEPGYYEDHSFGIRIENLLVVKEVDTPNSYGGVRYFGFEKLTYVPIQGKLIELSLMSSSEIEWVNQYHAEVWEKVSPHVEAGSTAHQWLYKNTRPLRTPT